MGAQTLNAIDAREAVVRGHLRATYHRIHYIHDELMCLFRRDNEEDANLCLRNTWS